MKMTQTKSAMYSKAEIYNMTLVQYDEKNEPVTVTRGRTESGLQKQITGRPAEIIHNHSVDRVDKVGSLAEIFVTPQDVCDMTTYSDTGSVRRRLDNLVDEGVLELHGVVEDAQSSRRLYLPAQVDGTELVKRLHSMSNRPIPPELKLDLEHVAAGQFSHLRDGIFVFDADRDVEVDVDYPEDDRSIRQYVEDQLAEQGLTANIGNFYWRLRDRVGMTNNK
jgi:hypothetical protein